MPPKNSLMMLLFGSFFLGILLMPIQVEAWKQPLDQKSVLLDAAPMSSPCWLSGGWSESFTAFFITTFLPPVGLIANLYYMTNGTKEQRSNWGWPNTILFGLGTVVTGILTITYLYGTFEFFLCLGLTIGFGVAMILGIINLVIASQMNTAPTRRRFSTPSRRHDQIAVVARDLPASTPLWEFSF